MKNIRLLGAVLCVITACSTDTKSQSCPNINIPREATRQYIGSADLSYDAFQIILAGNENYCYTENTTGQRYAVITPIFKIRRLEDSSDSSVNTSFYVKPIGVDNHLGKQVKYQTLKILPNVKEQVVKGNQVKLRIADQPYDDFSIEMGLNLSEYANAKAKRMFDIDYKYLSKEDLDAHEEKIETEFLEIGPDEKVVFCEQNGRPVVVKKGSNHKNCD